MIIKRKVFSILTILLCLSILCFFSVKEQNFKPANAEVKSIPQIILDAGHGGFDGGAVANDGTVEKDINLLISKSLKNMLLQNGYHVIMTRDSDVSTDDVEDATIAVRKKSDLKNRLELMKDYPDAIFVSIHLNKFTTSAANGSQVFYGGKNPLSKSLSDSIQSSIVRLLQPENTRVNKKATTGTYILYNAPLPAVLVECGFLSNSSELKKLKDAEYQRKMAFSIFCGITEYLR